ncbi:MAG: iron hydrogenase [Oscillospiraceae bacterium]|nr:iron hydrogenase [Oscillospiraceae bacterium]
MTTFKELYKNLVKTELQDQNFDKNDLNCLLNPKYNAPKHKIGEYCCSNEAYSACAGKHLLDVLVKDEKGNLTIDKALCIDCKVNVENCSAKKFAASKDVLPVIKVLTDQKGPVYALIAPAFNGQFRADVTPGKLRSAFKALGFCGMIEVALFADILTLKEALEFDRNIKNEGDFQLTSCCCPIWITMIRKIYHELMPHVPGSVSPMIAAGRTLKRIHPHSVTVFVGPCVAKKAEAKEKDLLGAIDFVLTFKEMQEIFKFSNLFPENMPENIKDHSSKAGRCYASAGGVSEAVEKTLKRLNPSREIKFKSKMAHGVSACKQMIEEIRSGNIKANFFEGMGCFGGCVGGPKAILDKNEGKNNVEKYGNQAAYEVPIDNPYVIELLHILGFDTVEQLLNDNELFTRKFVNN